MEGNTFNAIELINNWDKLQTELRKNKKIDFELFNKTFSQTYDILSQHASDDCLDKKYIQLISTAYLFANTINTETDSKCRAILTLTERMISYCAFSKLTQTPEGAFIYVLDARKDVYINFKDIDESIIKLEKLFDEDFWRNL